MNCVMEAELQKYFMNCIMEAELQKYFMKCLMEAERQEVKIVNIAKGDPEIYQLEMGLLVNKNQFTE